MSGQETQGDICIQHLCGLGGVSRAGFYRHGEVSAPERTEADLRDKIQKIALENRFYGYRRVCRDLWRIHGLKVNHKHVRRLMREDNLLGLRAKPFVPYTTNSRHEFPIVPNLVRGLVPTGIDQIWVADTSDWRRSSFTWPSFSTPIRARWSVGRSPTTSRRAWLSKRSTWRWRPAVPRRVSSTTPTAACNMPATNIANGWRPTASKPA